MPKTLAVFLGALTFLGCQAQPTPGLRVGFPDSLGLQRLSAERQALLRATLEVEGLPGGENPMKIKTDARGRTYATGTYTLDVSEEIKASLRIRLYGRYAEETPEVLLARLEQPLTIKPHEANAPEITADFASDGAAIFDVNRNGLSNLEDLQADIDPSPPPPFADVAPTTLEFYSGIRLGDFERRIVLLQNQSADPVQVRAQVFDAPGVLLARVDLSGSALSEGARRALGDENAIDLPPYGEALVGVSFAPMNAYLTTGAVLFQAFNQRTLVTQSYQVKIIANSRGELQPAPHSYAPALPGASADLGGVPPGAVAAYPKEALFSGLAMGSRTPGAGAQEGGSLLYWTGSTIAHPLGGEMPADAVYLVEIPAEHRFSATLSDLASDVDLGLFLLDAAGELDTEAAPTLSSTVGTDPEALELRNDSGAALKALLVLGRHELREDEDEAAAGQPGALSEGEEGVPFSVAAHVVSGPEFDEAEPLDPTRGPLEGGVRFELRGRGFMSGARVTLADAYAIDVEVLDEGRLVRGTLPPGSMEVGKNPATVVVQNPGVDEGGDGQAATLPEGFTYEPPAPRLTELKPTAGLVAGGTPVSLLGAFFSSRLGGPQVQFGETVLEPGPSLELIDSTQIKVIAPPMPAGAVQVRVINFVDGGGAAPSNPKVFTYVEPQGPAPQIHLVQPASGSVDGGDQIEITGADFHSGASVLFGSASALSVSFEAGDRLLARAPAHAAGAVDVVVINPDGQIATAAQAFTYVIPAPSVAGVFPRRVSVNGGDSVAVDGNGFRTGVTASFALGADVYPASSLTRLSLTRLLITTPEVGAAGSYQLRVRNPDGQQASFDGVDFLAPAGDPPEIVQITPSSGPVEESTAVSLLGAHFDLAPPPTVLVGTTAVEEVSVNDDGTQLDFATPLGQEPGQVVVRVINADGQSAAISFTFHRTLNAPPRIFSISPAQVFAGVQVQVTLRGSGFDLSPLPKVTLGLREVAVTPGALPSQELRFNTSGSEAPGQVVVRVINTDGQSDATVFTFLAHAAPPPRIDSVSPAAAFVDKSVEVTVVGSGFDVAPPPALWLGQQSVTPAPDSEQPGQVLRFSTPTGAAPGHVLLRIVNADGQADSIGFELLAPTSPPPQILRISPGHGSTAGGYDVVLSGDGFDVAGAVVMVAGVSATVKSRTQTSLSFVMPLGAGPGAVPVRVRNGDGQWAETFFSYVDGEEGGRRVTLLQPLDVHALVPGDVLDVYGVGLDPAGVAAVQVQGPGETFAAALRSGESSEDLLRVQLTSALPEGGGYRLQLTYGDATVLQVPFPFTAHAPRLSVAGADEGRPVAFRQMGLWVFGDWLNPDGMTGVAFDDGEQRVSGVLQERSETMARVETPAGGLAPGSYDVVLIYSGGHEAWVPRTLQVEPLKIDELYPQMLPAEVDLDGQGLSLWGDNLGDAASGAGALQASLLRTDGSVAVPSTQISVEEVFGDSINLRFVTPAKLSAGERYDVLILSSDLGELVRTDSGWLQAQLPGIQAAMPAQAEPGQEVLLLGYDFDMLHLYPDGGLVADNGQGQVVPLSYANISSSTLRIFLGEISAGDWSICVPLSSGGGCDQGQPNVNLQVVTQTHAWEFNCNSWMPPCGPGLLCNGSSDGPMVCLPGRACDPAKESELWCGEHGLPCLEPDTGLSMSAPEAWCDAAAGPCTEAEQTALGCEAAGQGCGRTWRGVPFCAQRCDGMGGCAPGQRCYGFGSEALCVVYHGPPRPCDSAEAAMAECTGGLTCGVPDQSDVPQCYPDCGADGECAGQASCLWDLGMNGVCLDQSAFACDETQLGYAASDGPGAVCVPKPDCADLPEGSFCSDVNVCRGGVCSGAPMAWLSDPMGVLPVEVPMSGSAELDLALTNEGSTLLSVDAISFRGGGDFYPSTGWPETPMSLGVGTSPTLLHVGVNAYGTEIYPSTLVVESDDPWRPVVGLRLEGHVGSGGEGNTCPPDEAGSDIGSAAWIYSFSPPQRGQVCPASDVDAYLLNTSTSGVQVRAWSDTSMYFSLRVTCAEQGFDILGQGSVIHDAWDWKHLIDVTAMQDCLVEVFDTSAESEIYNLVIIENPWINAVSPDRPATEGFGSPIELEIRGNGFSHDQDMRFADDTLAFAPAVVNVWDVKVESPTLIRAQVELDCSAAGQAIEVYVRRGEGTSGSDFPAYIYPEPPRLILSEVVVDPRSEYACNTEPWGWGTGTGCDGIGPDDAYVTIKNPSSCDTDLDARGVGLHIVTATGGLPNSPDQPNVSWLWSFASGCSASAFGGQCTVAVSSFSGSYISPLSYFGLYEDVASMPRLVDSISLGSRGVPDGAAISSWDAVHRCPSSTSVEGFNDPGYVRSTGEPLYPNDSECGF